MFASSWISLQVSQVPLFIKKIDYPTCGTDVAVLQVTTGRIRKQKLRLDSRFTMLDYKCRGVSQGRTDPNRTTAFLDGGHFGLKLADYAHFALIAQHNRRTAAQRLFNCNHRRFAGPICHSTKALIEFRQGGGLCEQGSNTTAPHRIICPVQDRNSGVRMDVPVKGREVMKLYVRNRLHISAEVVPETHPVVGS